MRRLVLAACILCLLLVLSGCATMPDDRRGGEDAFPDPSRDRRGLDLGRVGRSVLAAAMDARTVVPAIGAIAVATIADWDRKATRYLSERNPVFGSRAAASTYSDAVLAGLMAETVITSLAKPGGDDVPSWLASHGRDLAIEIGAIGAIAASAEGTKRLVRRERPSGENDGSFPSSHTAVAFGAAALASRNIETLGVSRGAAHAATALNTLAAASVGYARVEAGEHHVSDVLAGAALGNFLSLAVHDSLSDRDEESFLRWSIAPSRDGVGVWFGFDF